MKASLLYGREIILPKSKCQTLKIPHLQLTDCLIKKTNQWYCARCQEKVTTQLPCDICQKECAYCTRCINMGKMCACCCLCMLEEPPLLPRKVVFDWQGKLSPEQEKISWQIVEHLKQNRPTLIAAVTGAGKTEMIFQGIRYALEQGGRVCIAAPRIDVCLELAPRIQAVFPKEEIAVLYGQSSQPYRYTKLVIATTHQLLKFKGAFSLLLIDEVDSFPFHNNKMLQQRIPIVLRQPGNLIYLTATPSKTQQIAIKKGELDCISLPARYHRHALPVPKLVYIGNWRKCIQNNKKMPKLMKAIYHYIENEKRFIIFLPHIELMKKLENYLKKQLPSSISFTSVHAQDEQRVEKVQYMRQQEYHFLLTTTILERGVTFSNIDVIVLGAEDEVFSTASLVQIAGRVGRNVNFPTGQVTYFHYGKTKAMLAAKKWIIQMNTLAKQKGLI